MTDTITAVHEHRPYTDRSGPRPVIRCAALPCDLAVPRSPNAPDYRRAGMGRW